MKRYIILDFDGTLIDSESTLEKEILLEFEIHKPEYLDKVRYIGRSFNGMGYREFLSKIFDSAEDINFMEEKILAILQKNKDSFGFFPGAIETVRALSLNYTLFLSTGNYTNHARDILKNAGIEHLFAHIQGSEVLSKSPAHISIFKEITLDPDFEHFALSVGDGEIEKGVAHVCNIDFIQVGKDAKHEHIIPSIAELIKYLQHFSDTDSLEIGEQNYIL